MAKEMDMRMKSKGTSSVLEVFSKGRWHSFRAETKSEKQEPKRTFMDNKRTVRMQKLQNNVPETKTGVDDYANATTLSLKSLKVFAGTG